MKHIKTFENYNSYDKLVDYDTNPMLRGYIECALFANLPEEYSDVIASEDINDNSLIEAYKDVSEFKNKAGSLLNGMDKETLNQVGMDFWYARNRHGVSFLDRVDIYGEETAKELQEIGKSFGEKNIFVSDGEFFIE